ALHRLRASTEIARALGGETDLDRVLRLIADRGRALVEARTLLILLAQGSDLVVAAAAGAIDESTRGRRILVSDSLPGEVVTSGRAIRFDDARSRMGRSADLLGVESEAAMLVPLAFRGRTLGVIAAFDRQSSGPPSFDAEDEDLMLGFAASAATAVATAQSVAEDIMRQTIAAGEQERRRWARDLHDETLQGLGGVHLLLASALREQDPDVARGAVTEAAEHIAGELESLRGLITDVRPAALDELGLEAAIEVLAERATQRHGLSIVRHVDLRFQNGRATRLAPELESTIYRLIQEALTNVAKHAGEARTRVDIIETDGELAVAVADDGTGFDPTAATDGFGLEGMRERVLLAGGRLDVESALGGGTTIRAGFPVRLAGG
ncbi:MAG: GAF domain-containing sensor histidine kinase, partial [Actinobacteria bacterium]|nr:GAF domain-containing sensor histidine kinase [Actinomycetota bacterium]